MGEKEEMQEELKEAIRILKSDGVHLHKTYDKYLKSKVDSNAEKGDKLADLSDPESEGKPPPVKDKTDTSTEPPKKRGMWWGDAEDD